MKNKFDENIFIKLCKAVNIFQNGKYVNIKSNEFKILTKPFLKSKKKKILPVTVNNLSKKPNFLNIKI